MKRVLWLSSALLLAVACSSFSGSDSSGTGGDDSGAGGGPDGSEGTGEGGLVTGGGDGGPKLDGGAEEAGPADAAVDGSVDPNCAIGPSVLCQDFNETDETDGWVAGVYGTGLFKSSTSLGGSMAFGSGSLHARVQNSGEAFMLSPAALSYADFTVTLRLGVNPGDNQALILSLSDGVLNFKIGASTITVTKVTGTTTTFSLACDPMLPIVLRVVYRTAMGMFVVSVDGGGQTTVPYTAAVLAQTRVGAKGIVNTDSFIHGYRVTSP